MAARKKTAKKKAVAKKKTGKNMVSMSAWEKHMAEKINEDSAKSKTVGANNVISVKGGSFQLQQADLGDELDVVILDWTYENAFYTSAFDPDTPQPPACFAISESEYEMAPHNSSPEAQCDNCDDCENNEWGSGARARSKACANKIRLALIAAADLETFAEDPENFEDYALLKLSPTSAANFKKYKEGLKKTLKTLPIGIVTNIRFNEEVDYEQLLFKSVTKVDDLQILMALDDFVDRVHSTLMEPFDTTGYDPEASKPKKRTGKKTTKKKTASKKKGRSKFSK